MLTISLRNSHFLNTRKLQLQVSHTYIPLGHAPTKRDQRSRFMNVDLAEDRDRKAKKKQNKDFYRCFAQEKKMCKTYTIHGPKSTTLRYSMLIQNIRLQIQILPF